MTSKVHVASFNTGCFEADYLIKKSHLEGNRSEYNEGLTKEYENKERSLAKKLANVEVLCLQEISEDYPELNNRVFLKELNKTHEFFHGQSITKTKSGKDDTFVDNLVAVNKKQFENCKNVSIYKPCADQVAAVVATHIPSQKKMMFVSAHANGCELEKGQPVLDSLDGDRKCAEFHRELQALKEQHSVDAIVIGADMNASPEDLQSVNNNRFNVFTAKEPFKINRSKQHTNLNPRSETYKERELDYIFTKGIATGKTQVIGNWEDCSSDHRPIGTTIFLGDEVEPDQFNETIVRLQSLGLAITTPIAQTVLFLYDVAWRFLRLATLGHFWDHKSHGSFKDRTIELVKDAGMLVGKVAAFPIALIGLQFAAMYGVYDPKNGSQLYAKIERALDGFQYLAPSFQPSDRMPNLEDDFFDHLDSIKDVSEINLGSNSKEEEVVHI